MSVALIKLAKKKLFSMVSNCSPGPSSVDAPITIKSPHSAQVFADENRSDDNYFSSTDY